MNYDEWRAGWRGVAALLRVFAHGEPRVTWPSPSGAFYLLGWWWEGAHVLVPEILEEERITTELETTFLDLDPVTGLRGTALYSTEDKFYPTNSLVVEPNSGTSTGYWEWECVKIGTNTHPNPVRRWLLRILLGATYSPKTSKSNSAPTRRSSPTPSSVLERYLDSVLMLPTSTSSGSSGSTTISPSSLEATRSS